MKPSGDTWFAYLLRCADGTLYTGIAKDVNRRCEQHNAGTASGILAAVAPPASSTRKPTPAEVSP